MYKSNFRNLYYLQAMELDVWELRTIKTRLPRELAIDSRCVKAESVESECTLVHEDCSITSTKHMESTGNFLSKSNKILVLLFPYDNQSELASKSQHLLENILISTGIQRVAFELIYIREYQNLEKLDFKCYQSIITMGDFFQNDEFFLDIIRRNQLPLINIAHPNLLLIRPVDKREAYLSLQQLEFNYV